MFSFQFFYKKNKNNNKIDNCSDNKISAKKAKLNEGPSHEISDKIEQVEESTDAFACVWIQENSKPQRIEYGNPIQHTEGKGIRKKHNRKRTSSDNIQLAEHQ